MGMSLIVQKYGGTSVGSLERIQAVARHIQLTVKSGSQLVVVVSAMGAQTDDLLQMAHQLSPNPHGREVDMLLTAGERISMALLAIALHELGVNSVSLTGSQSGILTDEVHGNARIEKISGERIRSILAQGHVAIVAGFQGVSPRTKEVTTLGRGGSDLTAIALAASLQAEQCEIYKDVDGVCTADPKLVPNAAVIPRLSWNAMNRLAWSGASILHARSVHVACKYRVPLEIRSSFNLSTAGTKVMSVSKPLEGAVVTAIAHQECMVMLDVTIPGDRLDLGASGDVLDFLWNKGESPVVLSEVTQSRWTRLQVILTQDNLRPLTDRMEAQGKGLGRLPEFSSRPVSTIGIVGEGFRQSPELVSVIRGIVGSQCLYFEIQNEQINIALEPTALKETMKKLHAGVIEST